MTGTFLRSTGPDQIIDGDFDVLLELPDSYRRNELTGFAGANVDRTEVLNGTDVWDETASAAGRGFGGGGFGRDRGGRGGFGGGGGGGGQRDAGPAAVDDRLKEQLRRVRQAELARLTLVWLLTTDGSVAWIGTAESPDGTADVVEVRPPNGVATRLFLEPKTHMPLMISWQGQPSRGGDPEPARRRWTESGAPGPARWRTGNGGAAGQQATLELHMGDYKTVGGVKLPHLDHARHRRHHAGRTEDQEFQDQSDLQSRHIHSVRFTFGLVALLLAAPPLSAQGQVPAPPPGAVAGDRPGSDGRGHSIGDRSP